IEAARASLDRALAINPRLLSAWLGRVDLAWANFEVEEALQLLREEALPLNPRDEEVLGRMAACYLLLDRPSSDELLPDESLQDGPLPKGQTEQAEKGRFARGEFVSQGSCLGNASYRPDQADNGQSFEYNEAADTYIKRLLGHFLEATERMPQLVGPRSQLGLLLMRTGDEDEAKRLLEEAFEVDPFNVRVKNMLEVLELLGGMETLETEHFIIKYDGRRDAILARYAAEYLDTIYPEMCRQFGYRPPVKPLLEIFNTADGHNGQRWFSTRLIGLPYLGIVAASTGRLVAMTSPNDGQAPRRFNWARVLKHELVHVVTLQQTAYNIPHWFTEGVAVFSEETQRPQLWNELLLQRVEAGQLFNLRTLNFGFTRPHSSRDWQMAYCQAELYVEYMLSRWGSGQAKKLLAAYSRGLTTAEAIPQAVGVSLEEFERGYLEYLKELTAGLSSLPRPSQASFEDLLKTHRERPQHADTAAELAAAYLRRGAEGEALELAQGVLKEHPKHQAATYVVARLRVAQKKPQEA
ncbi:hypothetical protein LCGC14_2431040, partial [marine sediment metagenome]